MDLSYRRRVTSTVFLYYVSVFICASVCVDATLSTSDSLEYLIQFGYLNEEDSTLGSLRTEESFSEALKNFQRMAGIPITGRVDNATQGMMSVPRCGNKDNIHLGVSARRKRYVLQGSHWEKQELTFRISHFPKGISTDMVEREVLQALKVWGEVTPLNFTLRPYNEKVDIDVRFARRHHGDGNPFDGRGRTLAHAFFPEFNGAVHFDDDEDWSINMSSGVNLFQVAVHEFGHSLGLSHSDVSTAIMAPFYRGYRRNFRLDKDDISAIQQIYGDRGLQSPDPDRRQPERAPNRGPVLTIPKICMEPKIDAITMDSAGNTYIFKGTQYYRLNNYGIDERYPREISEDWKGLSGPIDSALHWDNGYTYIFQGNFYWKFNNFKLIYVRSIAEGFKGIPNKVDASFVWGGNGKTYFFKGDQYWRYTVNHADPGYPKPLSMWTGLPAHIDAAIKWKNGRTYFFTGDLYYRYNDKDLNVDISYPRNIASWWLGCPDKEQIRQILQNMASHDNQSKESGESLSQSQSNMPDRPTHDEGTTSSEQFLPEQDDRQMDFLHDAENDASAILITHNITVTFLLVNIILLLQGS